MRSDKKTFLGYTFYAIGLAAVLLYLRFPAVALMDSIEASISEFFPRVAISAGKVRPAFPPGIELLDARLILRRDPNRELLVADKLKLQPKPLSWIEGDTVYRIRARTYAGSIHGSLRLAENRAGAVLKARLEWQGLNMARNAYLQRIFGGTVKGVLQGSGSYSGNPGNLLEGGGKARFRVAAGRLPLARPFFGLRVIDWTKLQGDLSLEGRRLRLKQIKMQGQAFRGNLAGVIHLHEVFPQSRLELKGELEPFPAFFSSDSRDFGKHSLLRRYLQEGKLSFEIRGKLSKPIFKLT
jgi:type II secretion system protein N